MICSIQSLKDKLFSKAPIQSLDEHNDDFENDDFIGMECLPYLDQEFL